LKYLLNLKNFYWGWSAYKEDIWGCPPPPTNTIKIKFLIFDDLNFKHPSKITDGGGGSNVYQLAVPKRKIYCAIKKRKYILNKLFLKKTYQHNPNTKFNYFFKKIPTFFI
jgi:hypothetical protein